MSMSSDSIVGDGLAPSPYEQMKASRDHFRDCISAREVRRIVDERDKLRAERNALHRQLDVILRAYAKDQREVSRWADAAEKAEAERDEARALLREANEMLAEAIVCGPKLRKYMPLRQRINAALAQKGGR